MASKETMTSRERVIEALNHRVPDRVPIDLGGFQTGIHRKAYEKRLEYLGFFVTFVPFRGLLNPCNPSNPWLRFDRPKSIRG